jgi:hypothetical protein
MLVLLGQGPYDVRIILQHPSVRPLHSLTEYRSKLKLYTSLHGSLVAQRAVLDRREQTLKGVRATLVQDGQNVVAGNLKTSVASSNGDAGVGCGTGDQVDVEE